MVFSLSCYALCTTLFSLSIAPEITAGEDITTCCSTGDGCCGPDWGLHCCNFVAKICCYGQERVLSLHHHNRQHWTWNKHWLEVTLYILLLMLLITGILLCCKAYKGRRTGRGMSEYTILPGYEYRSQQSTPPTAPVVQAFRTNDEYPLMNYQKSQPRGHSLNTNQAAPPPPYYEVP
ncbi:uncharacterized protein LOC111867663 [Cryptotermes secundus]|uniref:uncharacterized protein LOC111867663 n=1 Tax=Cryptotermes secundus TaxID=105785 RepID=UPI000CD7C6B1|nr:uncharacterized protein LOC111867663 [Cryptotermes secundus]